MKPVYAVTVFTAPLPRWAKTAWCLQINAERRDDYVGAPRIQVLRCRQRIQRGTTQPANLPHQEPVIIAQAAQQSGTQRPIGIGLAAGLNDVGFKQASFLQFGYLETWLLILGRVPRVTRSPAHPPVPSFGTAFRKDRSRGEPSQAK